MKPSKDFSARYDAAKRWRNGVERDIKDALRFCANGREKDFTTKSKTTAPSDIYMTIAEELATDLAGDLVTYYTPPEVRWADFIVTTEIPEDAAEEVLALVNQRENSIFELIEGSNYYDIAPQVMFETAAHGTPAMWVEQAHLTQPVYVETVPPHELLITPGHMGILDRFREKTVLAQHLPAVFAGQDVDLSGPELKKKMDKPGETALVCWGFWLDWSEPAYPIWKQEITIDGRRVTAEGEELGPLAGTCPLLVGRFNPQPGRPWGRGPGVKALADIFTGDKINEIVLTNLDYALQPSHVYPDDGILDMSEGIQPNTAYPARPGTAGLVQKLDLAGSLDYGWFSEEKIEQRLRTAFYQDGPRQRGDTPPSATQWIDEARRVQRRLGKPSAPLWSELIYPFIQRVEYLGVQTGKISETITHAGHKLTVSPISPLQKAQNQDKVLITRSNLDAAFQVFGEQLPMAVDVMKTMKNIKEASGDELLILKEQEEQTNETPPPAA